MKSTGISNDAIFSFYQTSMALCRKFIELTLRYDELMIINEIGKKLEIKKDDALLLLTALPLSDSLSDGSFAPDVADALQGSLAGGSPLVAIDCAGQQEIDSYLHPEGGIFSADVRQDGSHGIASYKSLDGKGRGEECRDGSPEPGYGT